MTDQELKDLVASLSVSQAETDRQMQETTRKLEAIGIRVGNIGQNQGAVAEEFFLNSLQAKPVLGGVRYDDVHHNLRSASGKLQGEYDVVMVNGKSVALIEVKYVVHPHDIAKTIEGIGKYRTLFPQHKDFDIYGGIASFKIAPEVAKLAKDQGLMVLQRSGDVIEVDAGQPHRF
jgi:hypothetical protein